MFHLIFLLLSIWGNLLNHFLPLQQKPSEYLVFHNNHYVEDWKPAYKKMAYYTIEGKGMDKKLKKVKLKFHAVEDECIGARITYFKIPGNDDALQPLLSSASLSQKTVIKNAAYSKDAMVKAGDKIKIEFNGKGYTLLMEKNGEASDGLSLFLRDGTNKIPLGRTSTVEDYPVLLLYAGDINGDGAMDLIVRSNPKEAISIILYTSVMQPDKTYRIKEVSRCFFTSLPC